MGVCEQAAKECIDFDFDFYDDVITGLATTGQKNLNPKYFYDQVGASLFDEITRLDEYYVTRSELELMRVFVPALRDIVGPLNSLIELGSGSGLRTELFFQELKSIENFLPVDVSVDFIEMSRNQVEKKYPSLSVIPVIGDFTQGVKLPEISYADKALVFFPGSTISNLNRGASVKLFRNVFNMVSDESWFLVTADLKKDKAVIESAYNDDEGVTAEFNLNVLARINRELNADFDLGEFEHNAFYNEDESRVEMHLVSMQNQRVSINGSEVNFALNESIHTEISYKFSKEDIESIAIESGWLLERFVTDSKGYVGQFLFQKARGK